MADGAADMIVSAESMHHWRHPVAVLDELYRALGNGARAWIFDGRDDFVPGELERFTVFGERTPPAVAVAIMRRVLHVHGFSRSDWESHVPGIVERSRFGAGRIEPIGMYRRLELSKARTGHQDWVKGRPGLGVHPWRPEIGATGTYACSGWAFPLTA